MKIKKIAIIISISLISLLGLSIFIGKLISPMTENNKLEIFKDGIPNIKGITTINRENNEEKDKELIVYIDNGGDDGKEIQEIINLGADVNCINDGYIEGFNSHPPLSIAMKKNISSEYKYEQISKVLIKNGADINWINGSKINLLHVIVSGREGIENISDRITFLVNNGIDIDAQSEGGQTALMKSSLFANDEAYNTLLKLGADNSIKNDTGETAKEIRSVNSQHKLEQKKAYDSILRIGMAEEEVKETKWGEPEKVNRTTTKYGVKEQWVYYGNKYIYLENGIVTTIQD